MTFWDILFLIGSVAFVLFLIIGIVFAVKKKGKTKRQFLFAGISAIFAIVVIILTPIDDAETTNANEKASEQESAQEDTNETITEEDAQAIFESTHAGYLDKVVSALTEEQVKLEDSSIKFINENINLFPANTDKDIQKVKDMTDSSITAKHLNKNPIPYFDKIMSITGNVVSIEEIPTEEHALTDMHVVDAEGQSYNIVILKSVDALEDDTVRFWGAPVAPYSFDNVSGGTTNTQYFIGSVVEKLN